jgi:hypothetical protein
MRSPGCKRPAVRLGVHLTVISEQPTYRWGPVLGSTELPSLVDESGYFYPLSRIDEFINQVDLAELEREYRAKSNASSPPGCSRPIWIAIVVLIFAVNQSLR